MSVGNGEVVGKGTPTWECRTVEGVVRDITTPADVLPLMEEDLEETIVLMHTAGATMLVPIFSELTGVLCTVGGTGSHVAILSREFGVPCLVGVELEQNDLDGKRVRIDPSGSVQLLEA
jgi:phosphoenolpyruvate-protein kinase (PTS system EI component)